MNLSHKIKYIAITTLVIFFSSCSTSKKESLEHFAKANDFYKKDDIKNALTEIDLAIKKDSSNLDYYLLQSKVISEAGNFDHAIQILNALLTKNFKVDTVQYYLGSNFFDAGTYFTMKQENHYKSYEAFDKSVNHLKQSIYLNPQFFDAYVLQIKALHNIEKYDEALITANSAINLFPDSLSLILTRGVEKKKLGDISGALLDLNNCINSNKIDSADVASAYRFRGEIYSDKGDLYSALSDLTRALDFNPNYEYAFVARANCYARMDLKEKACEDYRRAAELGFVSLYETIKTYCNE